MRVELVPIAMASLNDVFASDSYPSNESLDRPLSELPPVCPCSGDEAPTRLPRRRARSRQWHGPTKSVSGRGAFPEGPHLRLQCAAKCRTGFAALPIKVERRKVGEGAAVDQFA